MASPGKEPGSPSEPHHHHHVSISALRSKFETLAHDTRDYVSKSRPVSPRPPAPAPAGPVTDVTHSASASIDPSPVDVPPVEPAPHDESEPTVHPGLVVNVPQPVKSKPKPPPKPASKPPPLKETTVVTAVGTPVNIPSVGSTNKIPPPRLPKPSSSSLSASPKAPAPSSPPVLSPTPIYERYSRPRSPLCQPSPPPGVVASPVPGPPLDAEQSPAVGPASAPVGPTDDAEDAPQSFAAIRERFAKGTAAAAPSPSGNLAPSKPRDTPSTRSSSARTSPAPSVHVQAPTLLPPLKKEKPASPHPPSSFVPPSPAGQAPAPPASRPKVAASGASSSEKSERAPPPPPPISRSASPSGIQRSASPAGLQRTASPAGLGPGNHTFTASPVQSPVLMRSESPFEIDEPVQLDQAPQTHRPPPPPPKSAAQREEPVIVEPTPIPHSHRPPPPPPKKSTASIASVGSADSQSSTVPKPPLPVRRPTGNIGDGAIPVAPPPLPQRSNTMGPVPDMPPDAAKAAGRPPLPGNKPAAPTLKSPSPPESVPQRPRSRTVAGARPAEAPPLPVRQNTISTGHSPSPVSRSRAPSIAERGGLPPPPQRSDTASTGLHRSSTVSSRGSGYAPPPRRDTISTPQRSGTIMASLDSDDEDDSSATTTPGLTSMAARLLEEHPDGSQANRRPPQFSPDIEIKTAHAVTAFTVYGRFVVCAHHHVKVYDTHLPEGPILDFDPKHMGLDSKVKEPRVTSLCFRPSTNDVHEGRYLWCGNRDGHIWELDIRTGEITATHPGVHSAAVTHIMRSGRNMVTLDEFGKLNVWEVRATDGPEDEGGVKMVRNLRITEKPTFVKMIRGQLWAATAPAVRSTTNSATARGPTVRVWDITYPGTAPPPLMALTTEWTGSATSATVMPLDPSITYIGHEGGFVSLWTISEGQLQCIRVLKVSSTDILSLEGVGERLWAGNRRGEIHAWKLDEMPWVTTNIWNAHGGQPVHTLVVDPYSIEATRRFMAWSCSRDTLHAWDGLLAVDWIDNQMVARQEQYCEFREVRILVCSWNIDSAKPTDLVGSTNSSFLPELFSSVDSPDIIVFGFQEVIPLTDKKLTAKTLLFGKGGSDRVSGVYQAWADKLSLEVRKNLGPYTKVHSEQLVGLFAVMFVKTELRDSLRDVSVSTVKRGIGGMYGNKGALVARMVLDDTSICFINVHLAAGQRHKAARNADLAAIMDDKAVFPPADKLPYVHGGDGSGILDHEFVILNGDLNYRIDQRRDVVIGALTRGDLVSLLEHDQLRKEMKSNHAFRLRYFAEAPIDFHPTYKYDPGTDEYDSSEKKRIPAWCDRVLFTSSPRIKALSYRRYEPTVSDHKPVSAALSVQVKRVIPDRMHKVQREIDQDWQLREADLLAQMADAYKALY